MILVLPTTPRAPRHAAEARARKASCAQCKSEDLSRKQPGGSTCSARPPRNHKCRPRVKRIPVQPRNTQLNRRTYTRTSIRHDASHIPTPSPTGRLYLPHTTLCIASWGYVCPRSPIRSTTLGIRGSSPPAGHIIVEPPLQCCHQASTEELTIWGAF